jgi:hypothetical protein
VAQPVEQLHYTWTPRGVEGANRFQIAAISAGLRSGQASAAMPMVRRLCSYEAPRGTSGDGPVSFGWLDHGEQRIAFHRVGLPPARGRPGNFAAHVLVGPPRALPEALIGRSFGSALWWRGATEEELEEIAAGKREFDLPAIDLEEAIGPGDAAPEEDHDAAMSLAHAVLTLPAERRLAVLAEGAPVGRAVRSLAELVPEALTGLSLSTYEGKPFFPFRVVGTMAPEPAMLSSPLTLPSSFEAGDRATVEKLLSRDQAGSRLRALVGGEARTSAEPRDALWRTARDVVAITAGKPVAEGAAVALMTDPDAVAFLATASPGRERLAAAAQSGAPAVLAALAQAAPRIEPGFHDQLCAAIAERYAESGQLAGCAALLGSLADGAAKDSLLSRVFALAAADEEAAAGLGADDAVLVLGAAARRGADPDSIDDLLAATGRHLAGCAAARSLPDAYVGAMLRNRLGDPGATQAIEQVIAARPALIDAEAVADIESLDLLELAERADRATKARLLPVLLARISAAPWSERAIVLARSLPPPTAGGIVVAALREGAADGSHDGLSRLGDSLAATLLSSGDLALALALLDGSGSDQARRARGILRAATEGSSGRAIEAARAAALIDDEPLREAVAEIVLERAVMAIEQPGDVDGVWLALSSLSPLAPEAERLRRLFAYATAQWRELSAATILGWTATALVARSPKLIDRLGHLDDSESEAMARTLVEGISEWRMAEVEARLEFGRRRGRKWWSRLDGHRGKVAAGKG